MLAYILSKKLQNSLLLRLGGMIVAITVLALVGMSSSWMVAQTTQGNGEAINIAGSLRMQSWRMASFYQRTLQDAPAEYREKLAQAMLQFERDLQAAPILSVLPQDKTMPINQVYRKVENDWRERIKPALNNPASPAVLDAIPLFVAHINNLVKHIEEAAEAKILVLRVVLGGAVIGTALIVVLSIYLVNSILVYPLRSLLGLTGQIRQGKLSARTDLIGEDEIGQLGMAFNLMAEDLSKLYQDLEARVEQKTAELTRSNHSLNLLYRSITRLHGVPPNHEVFLSVLKDAESVLDLGHGVICLKNDREIQGQIIATTDSQGRLCQPPCTHCHSAHVARLETLPDGQRILRMPLTDAEKRYGILAVEVPRHRLIEVWQVQLLEALSRHIGVTIASERRIEQHRRVALLEERAVIARELHDSLAQSLAYMRIQVSRLRNALGPGEEEAEVSAALEELRDGLNSAYQQLRELLSTFRLRMEDADLGMALAQTVNEFAERGNLPIDLEVRLNKRSLTPNEEIHLLQIAREALSNVLKHARARHAWVGLHSQDDGTVRLRIEDDGAGILHSATPHHYGMTIMDERARALYGRIRYLPRGGGGTCVELEFPRPPPTETTRHAD